MRPLAVLGRGFRSVAFETPGGIVVKVGLSPDAAEEYAREWRIGNFLVSNLGPIVPKPLWYAEPSDDLPHGAIAYVKLEGATPAWDIDPGRQFAADLGAFLARLHSLPVDAARRAGVPEVDSYARVLRAKDVVLPMLAMHLEPRALERVRAWWSNFEADGRMRTSRRSVCHHDLWHDNLLRSGAGRLSGVLDMAHVEVGDPAHDFAAPRYFGEPFMARLLSAYRSEGGAFDDDDAYRAVRFHEAREFGGLAWAIEHEDVQEIEESVTKVLKGGVFR